MTEDDWLDACADEPDDDLRRFAFADWLADRGDHDRAEFIRLQVALSRVPRDERGESQVERATEMLTRHRAEWLGPLGDPPLADAWEFPRGLPEVLPLSRGKLRPEAVARLVRPNSPPPAWKLSNPSYRQLGTAGAQALAAYPHLARVTYLDVWGNQIGNAGAQALAASPQLARLNNLNLGHNQIEDAGAEALAASRHLSRLITFSLGGNEIWDEGARALAASPHLVLKQATFLPSLAFI